MELEVKVGAGQGMDFNGEVDENLGNRRGDGIFPMGSQININLDIYFNKHFKVFFPQKCLPVQHVVVLQIL